MVFISYIYQDLSFEYNKQVITSDFRQPNTFFPIY